MLRKRSSRTNEPTNKIITSPETIQLEKRQLRIVPLAPPDFVIGPKILLEDYVEKEVWYVGTLSQVPASLDITRRSEILSWIDRGYTSSQLVLPEQEVIISINAQNVKLMRRYIPEEVILRVPIDELGSVVYLRDDGGHLVLLLHTTPPIAMVSNSVPPPSSATSPPGTSLYFLSVLHCDSRMSAEEICALVRQCFQLVYTEATMLFLDSQLSDGPSPLATAGSGSSHQIPSSASHQSALLVDHSLSVGSTVSGAAGELSALQLESWSCAGTDQDNNNGMGAYTPPTSTRKASMPRSENDIFENYMSEMRALLSEDERAEFAGLLRSRQQGAPFPTFCRRLLQLYTMARIHLLEGFRPFVDACDRPYFDEFVAQHMSGRPRHQRQDSTGSTVHYARSASSGASSSWSDSTTPGSRGVVTSSAKPRDLPASFDQRLSAISQEISGLGSLVLSQEHAGLASASSQPGSEGVNLRTARF